METENSQYVIVSEYGIGKFAQTVQVGNHTLRADEPKSAGGDDTGPSPYDFLLIALGTCTSMTVRIYANLKKIPLQKIIVKLKHSKVHATDCVNCEDENMMLDQIERHIELQGDLSKEQREKLLAIASKCPVHRTLTSKINIVTSLSP